MSEENVTEEAEETATETTINQLFESATADEGETVEAEAQAEPEAEAEPPSAERPSDDTASQDEVQGLKAALAAERKKRQDAEAAAAAKVEPEKTPDPIEDPEGYKASLEKQAEQSGYRLRADISRSVMLSLHDDYAEKEAEFMALAENDPTLVTKLQAADNPAKFAYDTAKEHAEVQKLRDPAYIDELAKQKANEILKQMGIDPDKKANPALAVPNATQAPAAGKNNDQEVSELTEIGQLF